MGKFEEYLDKIKEHDKDLAEKIETQFLMELETRDETIKHLESKTKEKDEKISEYARENYELARKKIPADDSTNDDKNTEPKLSLEERINQAFRRNN